MSIATEMKIPYCAKMQFDGMSEFLFGTVVIDKRAQHHEVEEALWKKWDTLIPGAQRPKIVSLIPGSLIFHHWRVLPDGTKQEVGGGS